MSFLGELKRRNVIRMALLYIVASWVVLQAADVIFTPMGLPDWSFRLVLGLLALGFPFALIFAWVFELTPEGIKRERDSAPESSVVAQTSHKMNLVIVVLLVVAIAGVALNRYVPRDAAVELAEPVAEPAAFEQPIIPHADEEKPNSIAVLPFVNMSGDPDNEYFSDGLTEELLNTLVRLGGLEVTGRTSSFAFKGKNKDLRDIGSALNVATVLEGSVRKAGDRVRITAQLIKTADGYHLWSDTFDRTVKDIFAVQEEIARRVADALHVTLLGEAAAASVALPDPQAHEEYLRGLYVWQRQPDDRDALERARVHFQRALEIDPDYVDATYGMFLYWDRTNRNGHVPFLDSLEKMRAVSARLARLAPDSARALTATARTALMEFRYADSLSRLEKAAAKFPGNAEVLAEYASSLVANKRFSTAMEVVDRASELDPLSLRVMRWKSFVAYVSRDCTATGTVMRRALELEPGIGRIRYYHAMCIYETTGDAARALPIAEGEPLEFARDTALAIFHRKLGEPELAEQTVEQMIAKFGDTASYQYGQIYAQWGQPDKALDWLEKAVEVRDAGLTQAGFDSLLDPLRGLPRFHDIMSAAGYPPGAAEP